jgi:hypothetical protein
MLEILQAFHSLGASDSPLTANGLTIPGLAALAEHNCSCRMDSISSGVYFEYAGMHLPIAEFDGSKWRNSEDAALAIE